MDHRLREGWLEDLRREEGRCARDASADTPGVFRFVPLRALLAAFLRALPGCEGSVWLRNGSRSQLVIVENVGPRRAELVGKFMQPLDRGVVSLVFASEQPEMANSVYRTSSHSRLLDAVLQQRTEDLIAVPLHYFGECVGVVSCVRIADGATDSDADFTPRDLLHMQLLAQSISAFAELRTLREQTELV